MRRSVVLVCLVPLTLVMASSLVWRAVATTTQDFWTSIGPAGEYVLALAIDPQQPTTLFVGTKDHGIYKSTDSGGSWQAMNTGLTSQSVHTLAIDPRTPTTIYAGLGAVSKDTGGIFKSTDGGRNWRATNGGLESLIGRIPSILALAIDPQTPTTVYAGIWGGVVKSTDAGGSWQAVNAGLDATSLNPSLNPTDLFLRFNMSERFVHALTIDPRTPTTLYAVAWFGLSTVAQGVFKSTDGGSSWRAASTGLSGLSPGALAIDPQTPTTLYARTQESGVFKSTDGGTWRAINAGLEDLRVTALAIDPQIPTTLYAGTWHGVFRSTDGGGSWGSTNVGLRDLSVAGLAIDPQTPTTLYAGTWGSGVFVSSSVSAMRASPNPQAGGSPADSGSVTFLSVGDGGSTWLAIEIREDLPVFAGSHKTFLSKTSSTEDQWKSVLDASGHGAIRRLWFFGSGRVSALLGTGLIMHTADGGGRWHSKRGFETIYSDFNPARLSFINQAEGWMLGGETPGMHKEYSVVFHTVDGGDHWTEVARDQPGRSASGLASEYKTGIEFYDRTHGWIGPDSIACGDQPYLYVTRDGGATWTEQSLPRPTEKPDGWCGKTLPPRFFGTQMGITVALSSGDPTPFVYQTLDGGSTWRAPRQFPVMQKADDFLAWDFLSPTIWAVASNQTLWLTSDAGRTWLRHSVPLPPTYRINRVALAGPSRVWLVGTNRFTPGVVTRSIADYIMESRDAGFTWARVPVPQLH